MAVPPTGLYGLIDLVGLDVLNLVAENLKENLPEDDVGRSCVELPAQEQAMLNAGQVGRKAGGGFYRMLKNEDGSKLMQKYDPDAESWSPAKRSLIEQDQTSLMFDTGNEGEFIWSLVSETLCYAADLIPEISDDIVSVDRAMRWGFNWKQGPFQMLDSFGTAQVIEKLKSEGRAVPHMLQLLQSSGQSNFYDSKNNRYFGIDCEYHEVPEE